MKTTVSVRPLITAVAIVAIAVLWSGPAFADQVTLKVSSTVPEYYAQEREIWDLYEEQNPNVKIDLFTINEDTEVAYQARVAAGNPADIRVAVFPNIDNNKTYVNLLELDYPYWDKFTYDGRTIFEQTHGVKGYQPSLNPKGGYFFTFIYYADEMKKAGLDPRKDVRSLDDLKAFLEKLKAYVDTRDDIRYVFDTGWHPRAIGRWIIESWTYPLGQSKAQVRDVYTGKIKWTDLKRNPFVPVFELLKEFTDKGYFPKEWWLRAWETEFEAAFISKLSILTFHGPWLWNKVLAGNPNAELGGFLMPTAHPEKLVLQGETTSDRGAALYTVNKSKPNWEEAVKAFNWFNSPEIVKLRAEAIGFFPAMDMSDVGGVELENPQFVKVIGPALKGVFGDVKFDGSLNGEAAAGAIKKSGTPFVMEDNAVAPIIGKYLTGKISIAELMEKFQARWNTSYGGGA